MGLGVMSIAAGEPVVNELRERVYALMVALPDGAVTTYGDLATMAGYPCAARRVGVIAHGGPTNLPWHRLVYADGRLAPGFPGGASAQQQLLEQDGIMCNGAGRICDFEERRWRPKM